MCLAAGVTASSRGSVSTAVALQAPKQEIGADGPGQAPQPLTALVAEMQAKLLSVEFDGKCVSGGSLRGPGRRECHLRVVGVVRVGIFVVGDGQRGGIWGVERKRRT